MFQTRFETCGKVALHKQRGAPALPHAGLHRSQTVATTAFNSSDQTGLSLDEAGPGRTRRQVAHVHLQARPASRRWRALGPRRLQSVGAHSAHVNSRLGAHMPGRSAPGLPTPCPGDESGQGGCSSHGLRPAESRTAQAPRDEALAPCGVASLSNRGNYRLEQFRPTESSFRATYAGRNQRPMHSSATLNPWNAPPCQPVSGNGQPVSDALTQPRGGATLKGDLRQGSGEELKLSGLSRPARVHRRM